MNLGHGEAQIAEVGEWGTAPPGEGSVERGLPASGVAKIEQATALGGETCELADVHDGSGRVEPIPRSLPHQYAVAAEDAAKVGDVGAQRGQRFRRCVLA